MAPIVIDLVIAALIVGMTYALMSEGLWGAALMFFNVLFAGLIAFNFYEPLAAVIARSVGFLAGLADTISLLGIFCVAVLLLRLTTETLAPAMVRFPTPVYHLGRLLFGLGASVITLAILLLGFEASPVHKKVFGVVDYKYAPPFKMGIDREWLGFVQYTTGLIFTQNSPTPDPYRTFKNAKVFDPRAEWLLQHQDARPYGTQTVLDDAAEGEAAATEGEAGGSGTPGAGASSGGARPGDPTIIGPAVGGGVVIPGN